MQNSKKIILAIGLSAIIITSVLIPTFLLLRPDDDDNGNGEPDPIDFGPPPYEIVRLSRFPISLDLLFEGDRPNNYTKMIDRINSSTSPADTGSIQPYPNYYHVTHYPYTGKWYLSFYGERDPPLPISLPVDSYLEINSIDSSDTFMINGNLLHKDLGVYLHLNYHIWIDLGHVSINQSIIEEYNDTSEDFEYMNMTGKAVYIPKDTIFGYTSERGMDYGMWDWSKPQYFSNSGEPADYSVNPYFYFTEEAQQNIKDHYQGIYEAKIESGYWFESKLNRTMEINQNHSFFGSWWYEDGWFELNESHHQYGWYSFDGCILNFLNVNTTDRESFYLEKGQNFTSDMIGVFGDAGGYFPVEGYDRICIRYMHLLQGNYTQGILNLTYFYCHSLVDNSDVYLRYKFIEHNSTVNWDDQLIIETFSTYNEAQNGFTSLNLTYGRGRQHMD